MYFTYDYENIDIKCMSSHFYLLLFVWIIRSRIFVRKISYLLKPLKWISNIGKLLIKYVRITIHIHIKILKMNNRELIDVQNKYSIENEGFFVKLNE